MDDELVREFLLESNDNLHVLDRELVHLEQDPHNKEVLASIFRTIHTIKGTCGFLGFQKLEAVAHVGENLLSKLRDGALNLVPEMTTTLLKMVDAVREMLESIEASGNEGERNDGALVDALNRLQQGQALEVAEAPPKTNAQEVNVVAGTGESPEAGVPSLGGILIERGIVSPKQVASAVQEQREGDPRRLGEILVEQGAAKPREVLEALQVQQLSRTSLAEASIRVDVVLLDRLMNLVGELVLARNQILQFANGAENTGLTAPGQRLSLITTELQEGVMKMRMQPIGNIWSKFPRTVRDVATTCGKEVRIEMEGKETELDKTIIEAIKDPLTHLVRNSVDHGIETPAKRLAAGKPAEGRLSLRAHHESGLVSYADFITLLFAFFVVLYASSQVDKRKVGKLALSIQVAFQELGVFETSNTLIPLSDSEAIPFSKIQVVENTERTSDMERFVQPMKGQLSPNVTAPMKDVQAELEKALAPEIRGHVVELKSRREGLIVSLREIGFYESGSSTLRASSEDAISRLVSVLKTRSESLRIEGHTDNQPIHNGHFASNWELSTARAADLIKVFIVRYGFDPRRLSAAGYAEFHPVAPNDSREGRARNRRVDIVVLNPIPASSSPADAAPSPETSRSQTPSAR